jgi:hypothetical protein
MFAPRNGFDAVMLKRFRSANQVRAMLMLAAVLGVAGSPGLHVEPGLAPASLTMPVTAAAAPDAPAASSAAHICPVCLLWGSVLSPGVAFVMTGNLPRLPGTIGRESLAVAALLIPGRPGRAPPNLQ